MDDLLQAHRCRARHTPPLRTALAITGVLLAPVIGLTQHSLLPMSLLTWLALGSTVRLHCCHFS
jgi:hypothetical protein